MSVIVQQMSVIVQQMSVTVQQMSVIIFCLPHPDWLVSSSLYVW
jgi:hypothetical protein